MSDFTGNFIAPDGWNIGENLEVSNGYSDSDFPGCEYRLPAGFGIRLAVNIVITGRTSHFYGGLGTSIYRTRVKIEFVGDGEPSTYTGAWLYTPGPIAGV